MLVFAVYFLTLLIAVYGLTITSDLTAVANKTFTHVIVGGGTAGLAAASRLAEDPRFEILVIEAGPDVQNNSIVTDPEQALVAATTFNYLFQTTPQEVNGKVADIPQGKALGGSSTINGMQYTRGTIDQYNSWEHLGSKGWNAEALFSYMRKSEHFNAPNAYQISRGATSIPSAHGTQGFVSVSYPQPYVATTSFGYFISSALNYFSPTHLRHNPDINTGNPNGASRFINTIIPGEDKNVSGNNRRCSSAVAYVYPYINGGAQTGQKEKLTILVGAMVTWAIWGSPNAGLQVASGVAYGAAPSSKSPPENTTLGTIYQVTASKEVIVASGALGSPHFLEFSGIGDPNILAAASIPVKVNLPQVGTNLQDQPLIANIYSIKNSTPPAWFTTTNEIIEGSVAYLSLADIIGPANAQNATRDLLATVKPRAEAIVKAGGHTSVSGLSKQLTIQAESFTSENPSPVIEMTFGFENAHNLTANVFWNLLPQDRGTVHVNSSNPAVLSPVNLMYLANSFDLFLSANTTKAVRGVMFTPPVSQIIGSELSPGMEAVPLNATDAQWQEFVRSNVTPTIHPVGSVAIGPKSEGGCVDSNLLVYGTKNVRVIDSSIIPMQISGHLSATVYGIAEKAADIIKASF